MTTNFRKIGKQLEKSKEFKSRLERNIAKGTTDPGVDCFDQYSGLVGLVQYA